MVEKLVPRQQHGQLRAVGGQHQQRRAEWAEGFGAQLVWRSGQDYLGAVQRPLGRLHPDLRHSLH